MTLPDTAAAVIESTVRLKSLSLDTEDECNAISHSVEHGEYWRCCHTDNLNFAVQVVTGVDVPVQRDTDAERRTGDD